MTQQPRPAAGAAAVAEELLVLAARTRKRVGRNRQPAGGPVGGEGSRQPAAGVFEADGWSKTGGSGPGGGYPASVGLTPGISCFALADSPDDVVVGIPPTRAIVL